MQELIKYIKDNVKGSSFKRTLKRDIMHTINAYLNNKGIDNFYISLYETNGDFIKGNQLILRTNLKYNVENFILGYFNFTCGTQQSTGYVGTYISYYKLTNIWFYALNLTTHIYEKYEGTLEDLIEKGNKLIEQIVKEEEAKKQQRIVLTRSIVARLKTVFPDIKSYRDIKDILDDLDIEETNNILSKR